MNFQLSTTFLTLGCSKSFLSNCNFNCCNSLLNVLPSSACNIRCATMWLAARRFFVSFCVIDYAFSYELVASRSLAVAAWLGPCGQVTACEATTTMTIPMKQWAMARSLCRRLSGGRATIARSDVCCQWPCCLQLDKACRKSSRRICAPARRLILRLLHRSKSLTLNKCKQLIKPTCCWWAWHVNARFMSTAAAATTIWKAIKNYTRKRSINN